ncbi:fumarylacetoacetate hydrolase family protein [Roseobacter sp. CCS2]|uniref:fumarylacetoacetate hydrolase family protein n=1 Tax=Roseobacter sp. CCS2 TaxID=391593 RepID=UPI00055CB917|nr:fumarylacetoacetate hydrolase family protein [Roseobacter sp. CCS2]
MKLCRIKTSDGIKPAAVDQEGLLRDLSGHVADIDSAAITPDGLRHLAGLDLNTLPEIKGDHAPFLSDVRRVFCIGLNYYDHAAEMCMPIPEHPILFMKACDVTGPTDPIVIPKWAEKTDWEVELGIAIGNRALHVAEADAMNHIAGYFVANDVSERHFQTELGGQWVKGKSADSFAPIGPYLATKDEVADPQNLTMWLDVNGKRMQTGSTKTMIFSVAHIVAHVSQFITLHPGDLILTGTPPGVGGGQKPPRFLKAGDVVTAEIEGLGAMRQEVVAFAD